MADSLELSDILTIREQAEILCAAIVIDDMKDYNERWHLLLDLCMISISRAFRNLNAGNIRYKPATDPKRLEKLAKMAQGYMEKFIPEELEKEKKRERERKKRESKSFGKILKAFMEADRADGEDFDE